MPFSWHIVANRKDDIGSSATDSSNYSNLRFPNAPKPIEAKDNKRIEVQSTSNLITPTTVANGASKLK